MTPEHLKNNHVSLDQSLYSNPALLSSERPVEDDCVVFYTFSPSVSEGGVVS